MNIKNIVFIVLSVFFHFIFTLVNLFAAFNSSLNAPNFIISLLFIIFWILMLVFTRSSKGIMIYGISLWSITFIGSIIALVGASAGTDVGFLMVPSAFLVAPLSGLRGVIDNPVAVYAIILVLSILMTAVSIVLFVFNRKFEIEE